MSHFDVPEHNRKSAQRMRKNLTDAELKFWNAVRAHRLMGLSFRRQMPINGYIVDFSCPAHKLVIEIDGSSHSHNPQVSKDQARDDALKSMGWTVIRVTNDDITYRLDEVCTHILRTIEQGSSPLTPSLHPPDASTSVPFAQRLENP